LRTAVGITLILVGLTVCFLLGAAITYSGIGRVATEIADLEFILVNQLRQRHGVGGGGLTPSTKGTIMVVPDRTMPS
jgi:hypothetical protein